jgi:DNA replication protein DnaC
MAGSSLYIHGTAGVNGNGKTRFASCVARSLVDAGISVVFANAKEITANRIDKPEDIERMKTCGALVIDDIGKEETGNSGWALGTMYELIDARYSAVKPIIATSNFTRGELADVMEAHGDKSTARAIASRLCEDCIPIEIGGSDMRVSGTR